MLFKNTKQGCLIIIFSIVIGNILIDESPEKSSSTKENTTTITEDKIPNKLYDNVTPEYYSTEDNNSNYNDEQNDNEYYYHENSTYNENYSDSDSDSDYYSDEEDEYTLQRTSSEYQNDYPTYSTSSKFVLVLFVTMVQYLMLQEEELVRTMEV